MQQKQDNISIPTLLQHFSNLEYGLAESISFDPKNFQCQNTSCFTSRKAKGYLRNWKKIMQDANILSIAQRFKIIFSKKPFQHTLPQMSRMNQRLSEIHEIMRKGAIH